MKSYIGDGVFVAVNEVGDTPGDLVLTTEDGTPVPTNRIVLESEVLASLLEFIKETSNGRLVFSILR
jgi:hypothetical protein